MIESLTTKGALLFLAGGITVGAGTGFVVGRATSSQESFFASPAAEERNSIRGTRSTPGEFETASMGKDTAVRSGSTSSGGSGWHSFTGPYTADRWMEFRKMLLGIPAGEIPGALEHLASLPASQERFALERELLAQWATVAPREALNFARAIQNDRHRVDATEDVLRAFAGREPQAAFQWLESQRDKISPGEYNRLFDDALRGYADQSLEAAIDHFGTWNSTLDRRQSARAIDELMESLIQQGLLAQAPYYLEKFPEALRDQAARELISELARVDITGAAAMLEQLSNRENLGDLQRTLIREWSRGDAEGAAAYLSENADQLSNFGTLASDVVRRWDDVTAASEWLSQYEPTPELDQATLMLVYRAGAEDPAGALTWAQSVNDAGIRRRALRVVASNWKAQDETAFQQFLGQNHGLSEAEVKAMESTPARRTGHSRGRWSRR